jgi:uridylate kinase
MDATAIALCRENDLPIMVFNLHEPGAFAKVLAGQGRYTLIEEGN